MGVRIPPSANHSVTDMKTKGRVAVLLSGRGSNFEAIYKNSLKRDANYRVVVVVSNKKDAPGLQKASEFGLDFFHVAPKSYKTKTAYERAIIAILEEYSVDLLCLAGYMKIVGEELLQAYENRIMNIHPALLPSFPGLHAQKQAVDHGVKISGCTVHFVDAGVDTGPIILQRPVEVRDDDSEDTLGQRILKEEHEIFSEAVRLFFKKKLKIKNRKVIIIE